MRDTTISFKAMPESVDVEKRILKNVILAQVGEAKGHGVHVEQKFIEDIAKQSPTEGVLSNFGHNWDNMGLQFGRVKSVRVEGNLVRGDLHIYSNADNSPRFPNMGTWLMNQAAEDNESVMLSISFKPAYYYQYNAENIEVKLKPNRWGELQAEFDGKPIFVALGKLRSVDIVDSGAITEKMFSNPSERTGFIGQLRKILRFDMTNDNNNNNGTNDGAIVWVGDKQMAAKDAASEILALRSEKTELTEKYTALETALAAEKAASAEKVTELNSQLQTKEARIVELSNEGAGEHTKGEHADGNTEKDPEMAAFGAGLRNRNK